jgi:hypothetical protein
MEIDKDNYVREAEQLVEVEGFTPLDITNLLAFINSTTGKKLIGTMAIEAKNNIMSLGNIDFRAENATIDAQGLRYAALSLNSFIDTVFGLVEEPDKTEEDAA